MKLSINDIRVLTAIENGCRQLIHIKAWLRKRGMTIHNVSSILQRLKSKELVSYKTGMWEILK